MTITYAPEQKRNTQNPRGGNSEGRDVAWLMGVLQSVSPALAAANGTAFISIVTRSPDHVPLAPTGLGRHPNHHSFYIPPQGLRLHITTYGVLADQWFTLVDCDGTDHPGLCDQEPG